MAEGLVYVCSWKRVDGAFEVWIKRRPKLRAVGHSFEHACESLTSKICGALGDGEAVLEFDTPTPEQQSCLSQVPPLIVIGANSRPDSMWDATEEMCQSLYSGRLCSVCAGGRGERTADHWFVECFESGTEAACWYYPIGDRLFVSDRFLSVLSKGERGSVSWQPVVRAKGRKAFWEMIARPNVPFVALRGVEASGWHCQECDYRDFYPLAEAPGDVAVCEKDLPSPLPSCFAIGDARQTKLCMTLQRWRELVDRKETKGCHSRRLIVVPKSEAVYKPVLSVRGENRGHYTAILANTLLRSRPVLY